MVNWEEARTRLATSSPSEDLDDYLDTLAHDALTGNPELSRVPVLIQALAMVSNDLTQRSLALALATSAEPNDEEAVDVLVAAFRKARLHAFLGPALLDALAIFALSSPIARAEVANLLIRLNAQDTPSLLIKAAQIIGRHELLRRSPDLRTKLEEFTVVSHPGVRAEAATQHAFLLLFDALQTETTRELRRTLANAQFAFARAECLEEHRPDAALFAGLLQMVEIFFELPASGSTVLEQIEPLEGHLRTVLAAQWWPGYRSESADVCVARALATADALLRAARRAREADDWTNLDEVLTELAALYVAIQGSENGLAQPQIAVGAHAPLADLVFAPTLGPVLQQAAGRRRLAKVAENYEAEHGNDEVARGLRAFVHVVGALDQTTPSGNEGVNEGLPGGSAQDLASLKAVSGRTPEDFLTSFLQARSRGQDDIWAAQLGFGAVSLPIDQPLALGGSSATHEVALRLLTDISTHLGDYPVQKWQRLVTVIESVVLFARHVFDTLPEYAKCQEDGGKGQTASETDLQKHLFDWLRSRFFEESIYEFTPLAGGRVDTGLLFPECRIPIEIKHEFTSVSREHVRDNYLTQADMYATATDRVSFLLILDLRASHSQAHRKRAAEARRKGSAFQATSLYTVDEAFWVDALPVDAQLPNARPKAVIIGAIPGNRPNPSSTTHYSVRPPKPRKERQSARARNAGKEEDM